MFTLTITQGKVGAETIGDRYEIEASGRDREVPFLARNARILVVARNLGRAGKIRKMLSAYGVMADITDSTKESCGLLQKIDYDLILADAKMTDREFVRYLEQIIDSEQDLEEASGAEAGNSVRIMSIHRSKGLEFPIVFVGGMGKQLTDQDSTKRLTARITYSAQRRWKCCAR